MAPTMTKFVSTSALVCVAVLATSCGGGTGPSATAARGAPSRTDFAKGDVYAAIGNGRWNHFDANGNLLATLDDGQIGSGAGSPAHATTGMCFDHDGNMYALNFSANIMSKFDTNGGLLAASVGTFDRQPESLRGRC